MNTAFTRSSLNRYDSPADLLRSLRRRETLVRKCHDASIDSIQIC